MSRLLTRVTAWGLGAVGLLFLPLCSVQAQEARDGAPAAGVLHPALYPDIAELIVPAGSYLIMVRQPPPADQSLTAFIVPRSLIEGDVTLEWLRRYQQRPDRFELRIRKARVVLVDSAGLDYPTRYALRPVSASPVEVELVLPASMTPKGGAGDEAPSQPARKLRWLQLDGSATFTWANGIALRLRQAHATLASIPDEGFQAPRLLFVEPLTAASAR